VLAAAGLLACYSCSDTWDDHYDQQASLTTGKTLYDQIASDEDLSDFREVLDAVKLIRSRKYAVDANNNPITYKDVFSESQRYTIWAPVNGTFDKEALINQALTDFSGDSVVVSSFIQNHYTRFNYSVSSLTDTTVTMMNSKVLAATSQSFGEIPYQQANIVCSNGILHKLSGQIPFEYNIYQYICGTTDYDLSGLASFLNAYQVDSLDANASIQETIDSETGMPIYSDSVMITNNLMRDRMGYIAREDSNYVSIVPTTDKWNELYEKVKDYYEYPTYNEYRDSLQRVYTGTALVGDLTYNMNSQYNQSPLDSLCSISAMPKTSYRRNETHSHIFFNPFDEGGPFHGISYAGNVEKRHFSGSNVVDCSNGQLIVLEEWPFRAIDLAWTPSIYSVSSSSNFQITEGKESTGTISYITPLYAAFGDDADNQTGLVPYDTYASIIPTNNNSNPDLTFTVRNLLKTTYDVGLIVVSPNIENADPSTWDQGIATFTYQVTYYQPDGTKKTGSAVRNITTDPTVMVDTIWVQKGFVNPVCSYGLDDDSHAVSVNIKVTSRYNESKKTTNRIRIAGLYMKPTEYDNE
jgi:hypothetical protein